MDWWLFWSVIIGAGSIGILSGAALGYHTATADAQRRLNRNLNTLPLTPVKEPEL